MAKKDKDKKQQPEPEPPVDLASRIGSRSDSPPPTPAPPPPPDPETLRPARHDAPLPPRRSEGRQTNVGASEPYMPPRAADQSVEEHTAAIPSPRLPPGPGESDLVVTPLPTPDDWHRFELALRSVRGVGLLRTEYYRHGVLKVRVSFSGSERLAQLLRGGVPGYRVRVIGEDRSTLQILVASESEERRPG